MGGVLGAPVENRIIERKGSKYFKVLISGT